MTSPSPKTSPDAIREFLIETHEGLEQVESDLVALERDSRAADASSAGVTRMFRMLHSIKGTCGFLGYPKLEELAHVGESLLGRVREGVLPIDGTVVSALLSIVDAVREVLNHIESENNEGNSDFSNLTQHVTQISDSDGNSLPPPAPVATNRLSPNPGRSQSAAGEGQQAASRVEPAALSQSNSIVGSLDVSGSAGKPDSDLSTSQSRTSWVSQAADSGRQEKQAVGKVSDSTLRIDVSLLDKMMLLAGDLVLTRNQILQDTSYERDARMHGVFRQLNTITSELQDCIMKSRMQPISTIWKQMPRMVRDVALGAFKQVRLELEGGDTELDKTIIEAIRDPLNHVLRNAVDHGIQLPELRVALGKPAEGRIWMRAYHAGGQVNIEIADDGAGIDARAIRQKALEQNLVAPSQVNQMSDLALLNLIFRPGFSTTRQVTKLSGRGVGLDVVQSNIEKLGGTIHVRSTMGEGTSFTLRIPLTLAIVQALIVKSAGDYYVVPQSLVVELIRLRGEEATAARDASSGVPVFRFRGRLLPIVHLCDLLRLGTVDSASASPAVSLVVLKVSDRHFGLVVDQIVDSKEVVIKPLWQPLRAITTYAGATQLGDGTVALILDPVGLAKRAGLVPERHEDKPADAAVTPEPDAGRRLLLARLDCGGRIALSTSGLKRVGKVERSRIKRLQSQEFMEFDGRLIRVVDVAALLDRNSPSTSETDAASSGVDSDSTYVALYDVNGERVGLHVGPAVDIVQHALDVRGKATRPHVHFTAMIGEQFVEFLDLDSILGSVESHRAGEFTAMPSGE